MTVGRNKTVGEQYKEGLKRERGKGGSDSENSEGMGERDTVGRGENGW